eukprot:2542544-Amphidinium_carterae.1
MNILSAARTWVSGENYSGAMPMDVGGVLQQTGVGKFKQRSQQLLSHCPPQTQQTPQNQGQQKQWAQGTCLCCGRTGHIKTQCKFRESSKRQDLRRFRSWKK